jgi:hypothetical protein
MSEPGVPRGGHGPRVPRLKPSWLVRAYTGFGVVVVLVYLAAGLFGWSFESEDRDAVPLSVRQSPGGYRSYHLWHAGFQGGK